MRVLKWKGRGFLPTAPPGSLNHEPQWLAGMFLGSISPSLLKALSGFLEVSIAELLNYSHLAHSLCVASHTFLLTPNSTFYVLFHSQSVLLANIKNVYWLIDKLIYYKILKVSRMIYPKIICSWNIMESQIMPKKFFSNDKICKYCKVHMVRIFWADDILKNT